MNAKRKPAENTVRLTMQDRTLLPWLLQARDQVQSAPPLTGTGISGSVVADARLGPRSLEQNALKVIWGSLSFQWSPRLMLNLEASHYALLLRCIGQSSPRQSQLSKKVQVTVMRFSACGHCIPSAQALTVEVWVITLGSTSLRRIGAKLPRLIMETLRPNVSLLTMASKSKRDHAHCPPFSHAPMVDDHVTSCFRGIQVVVGKPEG